MIYGCIYVRFVYNMSTTTTLYLHHHGNFTPPHNIKYVGGKTEIIKDFNCDTFSFRDLKEFAEKYAYDVSSSLVNFTCNGYSFEKSMRVIYDDNLVRDLINICKPYGRIKLYVDHFDLGEVIDGSNIVMIVIQSIKGLVRNK